MTVSSRYQSSEYEALATDVQVSLRHVSKVFPGKRGLLNRWTGKARSDYLALDDISLDIQHNKFVSIIGPSGCGKSTLLSIIAGLSTATSGSVWMDGKPILGPGPDRGMVFQNYALMPWMTVEENIRFAVETVYSKMSLTRQKKHRS